MKVGAADGRGARSQKAAAFAEAIEHWRQSTSDAGLNLEALHSWLVRENGYDGSLRSVTIPADPPICSASSRPPEPGYPPSSGAPR
ncbi:hypothetical protein RGUI_3816 [Rhodovulum sp. P5]|uniref:hypothetical protein n=1 Tax=Rhodovulum sp. P5 TaxID=1564506 RepID=UPI0009C21183|nr:hypothetical protein [Rhodovulum sp. P5]ARE41957.1 hypothetical protein RGUI_3816 [Rhodovulum sp. P5]